MTKPLSMRIPGKFLTHDYVIYTEYDAGKCPNVVQVFYKGDVDSAGQALLRETSRTIFLMEWNGRYKALQMFDVPTLICQKNKLSTDKP